MKKIIIAFLCLACVLPFASCGKEEKQKPIGTDVEYYAKLGQIPEIEYKLGSDPDTVIAQYEQNRQRIAEGDPYADNDELNNEYLGTFENGKKTCVAVTGANYYFDIDSKSAGINCILTFNGGYGFENGALINEVTAAMESYGHKAKSQNPSDSEISDFGLSEVTECLKYVFGKNTVEFFFQDSALCATALYKN